MSPVLDMTIGAFHFSYARWKGGGAPDDLLATEISNDDGQTWVLIEEWTERQADWEVPTFNVGDFIATSPTVRLRFSIGDFGADSTLEAGIDTFSLTQLLCEDPGGCVRDPEWLCDGDVDGDGQVNPVDSGLVQAAFGSTDEQDVCNYDVDCDGQRVRRHYTFARAACCRQRAPHKVADGDISARHIDSPTRASGHDGDRWGHGRRDPGADRCAGG